MELLTLTDTRKQLVLTDVLADGSTFTNVCMQQLRFTDANLSGTKIINANLSDLEIEDAQLGGAYIHNIGMPPKGHPKYNAGATQRPLRFENCDLNHCTITDCNLSGVEITDCNLEGMKINGIPVNDLLTKYHGR